MRPELYQEMAVLQETHWWFVARRQILAALISRLGLPSGAEILEIGCGTGGNLAMLATFGQVQAMEYDEYARSIAADLSGIPVAPGGLPEPVPFADGRFDLVCLLDVLEHIEDDCAALARAKRLLKPNGRLLLTVPAYTWLWSAHDTAHHHHRRYTAKRLRQRAAEAGLAVCCLGYFNTLLFPLIAGMRMLRKLAGSTGNDSDAAMPSALVNTLLTRIFGLERHPLCHRLFPFGTSVLAVLSDARDRGEERESYMSERLLQPMACYDVILSVHEGLDNSDEFTLGMRDLQRRLPGARRWYRAASGEDLPSPSRFSDWSNAPFILVILNPALLISNNLVDELLAVVTDGDATCCVLPSDTRGFTPGVSLDYASRPGFDRFVSRLSTGPRSVPFDGRTPWLYLITQEALTRSDLADVSWEELPTVLGAHTAIAGHAYLHSYADYYESDRIDMLRLIPDEVSTLLDIGGGAGNFGMAFMRERGGHATLLEQNRVMADAARQKGLTVLEGDFHALTLSERYDCVAFLDVLEHISDPLAALIKARQALKPGGRVLLSVPNVGHWSVVWDLLEGSFEYLPVGILCTTHLRFFTRSGLHTLLCDAGLEIERWEDEASPLPAPFAAFLENRVTPGVAPDLESLTVACFRVLARRSGGA